MTYMKTYVICSYKAYTQAHVFLPMSTMWVFTRISCCAAQFTTYIARFWQRIVKG